MKPTILILFLSLLFSAGAPAQVITDKPTFINNLMQVFHYRDTRFDSLIVAGTKSGNGFASKLKLPKADECYILNNCYYAGYAFKDSAQAIDFIQEARGLITEAATAYNARVRFVSNTANPHYQKFHIGNNEFFYTEPDLINFLGKDNKKPDRPFSVYLIFNGANPTFSYYTSAGKHIANTEITKLINEIGFGKDKLMQQIKGEKTAEGSYKSKRTLKGYTAAIYEENDDEETRNVLEMIKKWTDEKDDEVLQKTDSLILNLKSALPDTYCYIIDNSTQKITFYPSPFNTPESDAMFLINYGRYKDLHSYYIKLSIGRFTPTEHPKEVSQTKTELYPFKADNGKYGYKNWEGETVVQPQYDDADYFTEERARVERNGYSGYIDINGKEIIPPKYDYAGYSFLSGITTFMLNGKWGIMDKNGKELVPAGKYDKIKTDLLESSASTNKFILVKKDDKYGFIDSADNELVALKYDMADIVAPFRAVVALNGKQGLIDNTGKILIPLQYDVISEYTKNNERLKLEVVRLTLNNKYGLADLNGKILLQPLYDNGIRDFSEGLTVVEQAGKCGYADKTGKVVILLQYERTGQFSEGLAAVYSNGKYGYIDKSGKVVIPYQYVLAGNFVTGMGKVYNGSKYGYIDKTGKLVVPYKYDLALDFDEYGKAKVYIGDKWGFINKAGKMAIPAQYEMAGEFHEGLAAVVLHNKYGFINKRGEIIIPCKYDYAFDFIAGKAAVELGERKFYIGKTGKEIK